MPWLWTLAAIATSVAAALFFRFAVRFQPTSRWIAWLLASLVVAISPCLVSTSEPARRFAATLFSIALLVKLYDLVRHSSDVASMPVWPYLLYLINPFWLVLHKRPPGRSAAHDRKQLLKKALIALTMLAICAGSFAFNYERVPFAIEHVVKVSSVVLTVMLLADCAARIWRLLGGAALDPMRLPALASTPAEFWRRWNRPVQQFLHEYPFQAAGGAKHPLRATMMAFIVSGLAHEYVFVMASGRLQAWQLLFFSLQGGAAIITSRVQPRGWHALPCIAATIAFNLATAILFFGSVNTVLPFYTPRD